MVRTKTAAFKHHNNNIIFTQPFYVTIVIKDDSLFDSFTSFDENTPLIVSSLYKHERKMIINHCKVRMHNTFEDSLGSKKNYEIHTGFKKFKTNVVFSKIYNHCDKFKYVKQLKEPNKWYLASFYSQLYFPPNNVLVFEDKEDGGMQEENKQEVPLSLIGTQLLPDLFKVILKRVIFTGYPHKVKKKRSVVRHMFFNAEDVRYFSKNEIYTKTGLKGKIKGSVGTHGLMKTIYNDFIKHSDTICMNLYKRVFPVLGHN